MSLDDSNLRPRWTARIYPKWLALVTCAAWVAYGTAQIAEPVTTVTAAETILAALLALSFMEVYVLIRLRHPNNQILTAFGSFLYSGKRKAGISNLLSSILFVAAIVIIRIVSDAPIASLLTTILGVLFLSEVYYASASKKLEAD